MIMAIVRMSRKNDTTPMEFEFESVMEAFAFYVSAKESYREDDIVIDVE